MLCSFPIRVARTLLKTRVGRRLLEGIDAQTENRMGELGMLAQCFEFKRINGVPGDYFEFGLWQGKTFLCAHRMKLRHGFGDMKLWGFDSFEGLPGIDDQKDNVWKQGQFAFSEDRFRAVLRAEGVREDEFGLVPGYYEHSLNAAADRLLTGRSAAIVYIDCDLYTSTRDALNFVGKYLVNGTVVCFDEYWSYKASPTQGEQKALAEFSSSNPTLQFIPWMSYCPLGMSIIVRRSDQD